MKVTVKWMFVDTGANYEDSFPVKAPLHAVKTILLAGSDWASPSEADQYVVKKSVAGEALDDKKSLQDLEVSDGAMLFLAKA